MVDKAINNNNYYNNNFDRFRSPIRSMVYPLNGISTFKVNTINIKYNFEVIITKGKNVHLLYCVVLIIIKRSLVDVVKKILKNT